MKEDKPARKTSYADAGVSIDRGNKLVERIKSAAGATRNKGVMGNLGGFGALYDLPALGFKDPVLVAGTDGVGTKIKLAIEMQAHHAIGIDLVAMCVNDLIVQGAKPLFFLDYYATSRLDIDVASDVIAGIADGCQLSGCALIGGETAEMPGMYQQDDYDLAGFCVGAVERADIINGNGVTEQDVLVALASSGPHANGFSLIRKILKDTETSVDSRLEGKTIMELLLQPTRIYVKSVLGLMENISIKAIAHITGGGITENVPRVLPAGYDAEIDVTSWCIPPVFTWLQQNGNVETDEMFRTFNCGIGMVICIAKEDLPETLKLLTGTGETAWKVGQISENKNNSSKVIYTGL